MIIQKTKPNLCPKCFLPITFSDADQKVNTALVREQASFRKKDEAFRIRFRATCQSCGTVHIDKIIKNVKMW